MSEKLECAVCLKEIESLETFKLELMCQACYELEKEEGVFLDE